MAEYTYSNIIIDPTKEGIESLIGKEVYFHNNPSLCLENANEKSTSNLGILVEISKNSIVPFRIEQKCGTCAHTCAHACIIEKKEEPYKERAKRWVEENNLKVGDYVKVTRKAKSFENGWGTTWNSYMNDYIGETVCVNYIKEDARIYLGYNDRFYEFPYFILEKVDKLEPKYVPFESKEEFIEAFHYHDNAKYSETDDILLNYGIWVKSMCLGNFYQVTIIKKSGIFTDDNSSIITWEQLLEKYTFLDGTPCGKESKDE